MASWQRSVARKVFSPIFFSALRHVISLPRNLPAVKFQEKNIKGKKRDFFRRAYIQASSATCSTAWRRSAGPTCSSRRTASGSSGTATGTWSIPRASSTSSQVRDCEHGCNWFHNMFGCCGRTCSTEFKNEIMPNQLLWR